LGEKEREITSFSLEKYLGKGEGVRKIERRLITQAEENKIMEMMVKWLAWERSLKQEKEEREEQKGKEINAESEIENLREKEKRKDLEDLEVIKVLSENTDMIMSNHSLIQSYLQSLEKEDHALISTEKQFEIVEKHKMANTQLQN